MDATIMDALKEEVMKVILVTVAALALSATAAMANCPSHSAQTKTEKPQTTASIQTTAPTQK